MKVIYFLIAHQIFRYCINSKAVERGIDHFVRGHNGNTSYTDIWPHYYRECFSMANIPLYNPGVGIRGVATC